MLSRVAEDSVCYLERQRMLGFHFFDQLLKRESRHFFISFPETLILDSTPCLAFVALDASGRGNSKQELWRCDLFSEEASMISRGSWRLRSSENA